MTTPAPPHGPSPYIDPELGIDALRDAVAAIRCVVAGDDEGVFAILTGTDAPRHVPGTLAAFLVVICHRVGFGNDDVAALLDGLSADFTNGILDQPRPEGGAGEVSRHR